jgi:hypothetical protein
MSRLGREGSMRVYPPRWLVYLLSSGLDEVSSLGPFSNKQLAPLRGVGDQYPRLTIHQINPMIVSWRSKVEPTVV